MLMIAISVIVCAHNPRRDYFRRVLEALREQTVSVDQWELLVVDNASTEPLAKWADISWHPQARHIREETLGVAWARVRGIAEAKAELLVFVDDDTVFNRDYLAHAIAIAGEHPDLGTWSGTVRLAFEQPPPEWTKAYWKFFWIREVQQDAQSRARTHDRAATAWGGGMCLRREVGLFYRQQWLHSPVRRIFGPRGQAIIGGEDTDLALSACDMGMTTGVFRRLEITHLIPADRMSEKYLLRVCKGAATSALLMQLVRGTPVRRLPQGFKWRTRFLYDCARKWGRKRRFYLAEVRGRRDALRIFAAAHASKEGHNNTPSPTLVAREHHPGH
jgi:glycosyltransferase involved in cell wall biosynthesis